MSVFVRNWELKTWVLKPTLILGCAEQKKFINLGLTAEPCRKPKANDQQLLKNKLKLKLKYEVNLRFETQI